MRYEFHPEAERELHEAASRYNAEVAELGLRFADEVERVIQLLLEHPELGSSWTRHFVLRKFPFSIVYALVGDLVYILSVAHGSREPGYWRLRVQDR